MNNGDFFFNFCILLINFAIICPFFHQYFYTDSTITSSDDVVEIKEEGDDDLFYMDAEIIPDSVDCMETDPLGSGANDDTSNSPTNEIE